MKTPMILTTVCSISPQSKVENVRISNFHMTSVEIGYYLGGSDYPDGWKVRFDVQKVYDDIGDSMEYAVYEYVNGEPIRIEGDIK